LTLQDFDWFDEERIVRVPSGQDACKADGNPYLGVEIGTSGEYRRISVGDGWSIRKYNPNTVNSVTEAAALGPTQSTCMVVAAEDTVGIVLIASSGEAEARNVKFEMVADDATCP
jgi:hypothetical protein